MPEKLVEDEVLVLTHHRQHVPIEERSAATRDGYFIAVEPRHARRDRVDAGSIRGRDVDSEVERRVVAANSYVLARIIEETADRVLSIEWRDRPAIRSRRRCRSAVPARRLSRKRERERASGGRAAGYYPARSTI
jgi:hypothetical protein